MAAWGAGIRGEDASERAELFSLVCSNVPGVNKPRDAKPALEGGNSKSGRFGTVFKLSGGVA
jgi:hypothetical protein